MAARIDDPALDVDEDSRARAAERRSAGRARACPSGASCRSRRSCCSRACATWCASRDARMSGTSYGACVLHVAPESYVGGPLAFVRDGDLIELDIPGAQADAEGQRRGARAPASRMGAAGAALHARLRRAVSEARHAGERGLRLRFPRGGRGDARSRDPLTRLKDDDENTDMQRSTPSRPSPPRLFAVARRSRASRSRGPSKPITLRRAVHARRHDRHDRPHDRAGPAPVLGQPVVVDNKPGAAGAVGAASSRRRSPTATRCSAARSARTRSTRACTRTCPTTR